VSKIVTEISEDGLAELSEFSLLSENAEQAGAAGPLPEVARIDVDTPDGGISALRWGRTPHGSSFCTAAARTHTRGTPSSSAWVNRRWQSTFPATAIPAGARTATTPRSTTPTPCYPYCGSTRRVPELVVGMSLGGLTAIRLGALAPDLVRELVLVDVTPSALQRHAELTVDQRGTVALMQGEREFPASRPCWT